MGDILSRANLDRGAAIPRAKGRSMTDQARETGKQIDAADDGSRGYDADYPQRLTEFMRTGWRNTVLDVVERPEVPNYAKRREQVSAAFPGETLVIPSGGEKVRANDTPYRFRPGTDFFWLTGEFDPDAVLILRHAGGGPEATLFIRPRSPRDTDEF